MEVSVKTVLVLTIMVCCFAVLVPKIFQPMLLNFFGRGRDAKDTKKADHMESMPPHMMAQGMHPHAGKRGGPDKGSRGQMGGLNPGMRAAAEMRKEGATRHGGGGATSSVMTIVLPMYAVGIVLYLLYTMTKIFGSKTKSKDDYLQRHFSEAKADEDRAEGERATGGGTGRRGSGADGDDEYAVFRRKMENQQELERLLLRADNDDIGENELTDLKRRLLETERQMNRILQAMSAVQTKVETVATSGGESGDEAPPTEVDAERLQEEFASSDYDDAVNDSDAGSPPDGAANPARVDPEGATAAAESDSPLGGATAHADYGESERSAKDATSTVDAPETLTCRDVDDANATVRKRLTAATAAT